MRKMPKLVNLLFEDIEDDIQAAYNKGPAAVRSLANSAPDKEELKNALKGTHDKVEKDDMVPISGAKMVPVGSLVPTQKEIDLMKSVAFPLGGFSSLKSMITSNTSTAPGSITISGNEVLDGHHRWSGVWGICGPKGKISAQDMELPGDTSQKLAATQLAIAAYKEPNAQQPSAADAIPFDIMGKGRDEIKQMLLDNVGEQTDPGAPGPLLNDKFLEECAADAEVAKWAGYKVGSDKETVKNKIADRVAENLSTLPDNPNAPERADMPQFDHKDIGGKVAKAGIYAGLQAGEFNVRPPFAPEGKTESIRRRDAAILERWNRLAGLIKD